MQKKEDFKEQYQLIHRAMKGYTYYELYCDQNRIGSIKKANVAGAVVRIRGDKGLDLISRSNPEQKAFRTVENAAGEKKAVLYRNQEDDYRLSVENESEVQIIKDRAGYSFYLEGDRIIHLDEKNHYSYVLNNDFTEKDNVIDVQRMYIEKKLTEDQLLLYASCLFLDCGEHSKDYIKKNRCFKCMEEFDYGYDICPYCGCDITEKTKNPWALKHGLILADRYFVGDMNYSTGNFLQYYGWDQKKHIKVSIREFYPIDCVKRLSGEREIIVYPEEQYQKYVCDLDHFMEDINIVRKLAGQDRSYTLIDGFEENMTGYLVYDLLDGNSLTDYICLKKKVLSVQNVFDMVTELCKCISMIHKSGIVVGEICPNKIYVTDDKKVKIEPESTYQQLAKRKIGTTVCSWDNEMSRVIFPGYTAPEMYSDDKALGPWIDVYSIGCVFYWMVTGVTPPEATKRLEKDELIPVSEMNKDFPEKLWKIMKCAMEPEASERYHDAKEMLDMLSTVRM